MRYVVQLIAEDASIADDEIVGCWRTEAAARAWADRFEAKHRFVSAVVKDLFDPTHPPSGRWYEPS